LDISSKGLEGTLNLEGFNNLKELNCSNNKITELNLGVCKNLANLNCSINKLSKIDLAKLAELENFSCDENIIEELDFNLLDPEKITNLNLKNNNLSEQSKKDIDISIFSKFTKLKQLLIGNDNKEKIGGDKYNHFVGSLSSLKGLTNLEELHISNTNINNGDIEDLPEKLSIRGLDCSVEERPESSVKNIQEKLYSYLTKKRLDEMYPDKSVAKLTNLWSERLKGHLDLSEYKDLEELRCENNQLTSLSVSKNVKLKKLNCSNNKLKEINLEDNIYLEELKCNDNKLEGLTLSNNVNLEELYCSNNELANLDVSKNAKIKKLDCSDNILKNLDLQGLSNLTELNCSKNNLTELLGVENFSKLKELKISDNKFNDERGKKINEMAKKLVILNKKRDE